MPLVEVNLKMNSLKDVRIDLTREMLRAGEIIAEEMRGNVKSGLGVKDQPLTPNKPSYAKVKIKKLGHAKPLIGESRTLVSPDRYKVKRMGVNFVRITLPGKHPKSSLTIGQIAHIHNFGNGQRKREFAGITRTAVKRVMAYLNDRIARLFK